MRTNTRKGFTLIELLIVVVIIGILAAIAIPKFANTKEKAYIASVKTDLRNLATAQEGYFADFQDYAPAIANLPNFVFSPQVTTSAYSADAKGWQVSAAHASSSSTCTIKVGGKVGPGETEGAVKCQ